MACTAREMIEFAKTFIGIKEYPANSNRTQFGEAYGFNGVPWCCINQWYFFDKMGMAAQFYGGKKTASCTTLMNWAKKKHKFYTSGYQPGDLVFYNFDNKPDADHIGLITEVHNGYIMAVEGNTSPDEKGSQNNGGMVCLKKRSNSLILGVYRPDYATEKVSNDKSNVIQPIKPTTASHSKINKTILKGQKAANYFISNSSKKIGEDGIRGSETRKAAVMVVQTALNKDYNSKLAVDGIWGSATNKAFGSHYVKLGERQWMVTALEILCLLKGNDPNGVEYPGIFGQGLKKACGTSKAIKKTFKGLCS